MVQPHPRHLVLIAVNGPVWGRGGHHVFGVIYPAGSVVADFLAGSTHHFRSDSPVTHRGDHFAGPASGARTANHSYIGLAKNAGGSSFSASPRIEAPGLSPGIASHCPRPLGTEP